MSKLRPNSRISRTGGSRRCLRFARLEARYLLASDLGELFELDDDFEFDDDDDELSSDVSTVSDDDHDDDDFDDDHDFDDNDSEEEIDFDSLFESSDDSDSDSFTPVNDDGEEAASVIADPETEDLLDDQLDSASSDDASASLESDVDTDDGLSDATTDQSVDAASQTETETESESETDAAGAADESLSSANESDALSLDSDFGDTLGNEAQPSDSLDSAVGIADERSEILLSPYSPTGQAADTDPVAEVTRDIRTDAYLSDEVVDAIASTSQTQSVTAKIHDMQAATIPWIGSIADDLAAMDEALSQFMSDAKSITQHSLGSLMQPAPLISTSLVVAGLGIARSVYKRNRTRDTDLVDEMYVTNFDMRLYPEMFG